MTSGGDDMRNIKGQHEDLNDHHERGVHQCRKAFLVAALRPGVFPTLANNTQNDSKDVVHAGDRVLAPMVRVGTLPLRLLALAHGADIVYTPETVARRLALCSRVLNPLLETIDLVDRAGALCLRLSPLERSRCVLQLGASHPNDAVLALQAVHNDFVAVDLNCGCPKRFSVASAMGAALLSYPDRIIAILNAISNAYPNLKVGCKLRMLPGTNQTPTNSSRVTVGCAEDAPVRSPAANTLHPKDIRKNGEAAVYRLMREQQQQHQQIATNNNKYTNDGANNGVEPQSYIDTTLALVERIYRETLITTIALHCRFPYEKTGATTAHWDIFYHVHNHIQLLNHETGRKVVFVANGDIFTENAVKQLSIECSNNDKDQGFIPQPPAVMLARAAQFNVSVFRSLHRPKLLHINSDSNYVTHKNDDEEEVKPPLEPREILEEYIMAALKYEMPFFNCKYVALIMWPHSLGAELRTSIISSKNYKELCDGVKGNLPEYYQVTMQHREQRMKELGIQEITDPEIVRRLVTLSKEQQEAAKQVNISATNDNGEVSQSHNTSSPAMHIEYSGMRPNVRISKNCTSSSQDTNIPRRVFLRKDLINSNNEKLLNQESLRDEGKDINNTNVVKTTLLYTPLKMEEEENKSDLPYVPDDRGFNDVYGTDMLEP